MGTQKVRKLKAKHADKSEPPAIEEPIPVMPEPIVSKTPISGAAESAACEIPLPVEPAPEACEKATPVAAAAKVVGSPSPSLDIATMNLSSPKAEFSLQLGSFDQARKSMILAYLLIVLAPTVIILSLISQLKTLDTDGARSLIVSMEFMLGAIAALGVPIMAASWANGFYPKGSCSKFASGSIFALLLGIWLVLVLIASNLESALSDFGIPLRLNRLSAVICMISIFYFAQAASDFMDNRKPWRKKMGADIKKVRIDLRSRFLDFDHRLGRYSKGTSTAWSAYTKFLVVPMIILVEVDLLLTELNLDEEDVIVKSIGSMFITIPLFGILTTIVRFARGFFPCGSWSRMTFGLACVPLLVMWAWMILVTSGIEEALAQNYFLIDMSVVILPVVMYVMFMVVFEVSEFIDGRRAYRRWIGLPVKPYTPAEKYDRFTDFDTFYASFAAGTRRGQRVLNTYATKLFAIIVLVALAISVCESPSNASTVEDLRSYFTPQELDGFMDHMIFVLLLLATANVAGVFFAWSYRDGSFSRLIMGAIVAILASQWAYYFWTSLAKILQPSEADKLIYIALFTSMALIIIRMMWEMYKGYLRSRNKYIDWRVALLRTEAALSAQSTSPTVCVSTTISPGNLNGRGT